MGIDLCGAGGYQRFGRSDWSDAQCLALLHGWEPEGTYLDWVEPREWAGYYYNANSGQTVTAPDAANLAAALTRALDNLVETPEDADQTDLMKLPWPTDLVGEAPDEEQQRHAFRTYAGAYGRERLEELIEFCSAGSFRIT
jgi:hypothetical protein